jgi:hypothetical protein
VALGSIQALTEMRIRNLPGGKRRPALKADKHNAICEPISSQLYGPPRPVTGIGLLSLYRYPYLVHIQPALLTPPDIICTLVTTELYARC